MAGQEGVYFTASAMEEMMSVNGQAVEMGETSREMGVPWSVQRCL